MRTIASCGPAMSVVPLVSHLDARGSFTEFFRHEWELGPVPVQWNLVSSHEGALRGLHLHLRHTDYMIVASGRITFGWHDLRPGAGPDARSGSVDIAADPLKMIVIPPGVLHGFCTRTASVQLYGVSEYWSMEDELGCHWADRDLEIPWSVSRPIVSARDAALPTLAELKRRVSLEPAAQLLPVL